MTMSAIETIEYVRKNLNPTSIYQPVIKSLNFPITEEQAEQALKECKEIQENFYKIACGKYGF